MAKKKQDVGDEVEAYCGKCKDDTVHVIEVIKNDTLSRVLCKSCNSSHRYRAPSDQSVTGGKKPKSKPKTKAKPKTSFERKWSRLMAKADADQTIEYSMDGSYTELNVIHHKTFGVGVVKEVLDRTKVEVVFQDGTKKLVQNR